MRTQLAVVVSFRKMTLPVLTFSRKTGLFVFADDLLVLSQIFLPGLSKGNTRVEIPAWFFFCLVANRSQVRRMVIADEEKLSRRKISTETVYETLKTHTKYAHIVHSRPTLRYVERFRNGTDREPYEIFLYERTFMSESFIEKHAISTELCNVNREKLRCKSHRVCRPDREPSRIPIRSLKRLRNKSRTVGKFVYARILPCIIPMSSTLYCYVNAKKLLNKKTFKFHCRERIRQCI